MTMKKKKKNFNWWCLNQATNNAKLEEISKHSFSSQQANVIEQIYDK